MSTVQFSDHHFQLIADIDTQFHTWLIMTFALVVTTFFAASATGSIMTIIFIAGVVTSAAGRQAETGG